MLKTRTDSKLLCHYVIYDSDWQKPAATEQHAAIRVAELCAYSKESVYLGFPWANLIDRLNLSDSRSETLILGLDKCRRLVRGYSRVITVCQHIYLFKYLHLLKSAGVTHIFWSHTTQTTDYELTLAGYDDLTIYPFPLLPVAYEKGDFLCTTEKKYLFSFVGARSTLGYRTDTRSFIIDHLSNSQRAYVKGRTGWHYAKEVYEDPTKGTQDTSYNNEESDKKRNEFIDILKHSAFSLCPSGTGPNSIRLWESLQTASIPVVLADGLKLPGNQELWRNACLIVPEEREEIKRLPELLESVSNDRERYANMLQACQQLAILYGPDYFVHDIALLFLQDCTSKTKEDSPVSAKKHLPRVTQNQSERIIAICENLVSEVEKNLTDEHYDKARLFLRIKNRDRLVRSLLALSGQSNRQFIDIMDRMGTVKAKTGWFSSSHLLEE